MKINPALLPKKEVGRPTEAVKDALTAHDEDILAATNGPARVFGKKAVASTIAGAEVLTEEQQQQKCDAEEKPMSNMNKRLKRKTPDGGHDNDDEDDTDDEEEDEESEEEDIDLDGSDIELVGELAIYFIETPHFLVLDQNGLVSKLRCYFLKHNYPELSFKNENRKIEA